LIAGIMMCAVVIIIGNLEMMSILRLMLQVAAGVIIYIAMLFALRDKWFLGFVKTYTAQLLRKGKR
ncbi:MAG: hypothetical protein ACI4DP_01050, partial [Candidatus Ornithomonoglobus sp.]